MSQLANIADSIRNKRVGLCLASGFFGFYHQAGVLAALEEKSIRPVRITGTSAGAITASMYAAGLEADEIRRELLALRRNSFWDMHWPLTRRGFGLLAGYRFSAELARVLPVHSFEECSIPLAVGSYDLENGRVRHFSSGPLIPAVYASCAYPYLFTPIEIDGRCYWDGGFSEKCALVPFLKDPEVDVVIVSYMARRESQRVKPTGLRAFLPPLSSIFADTPQDERQERDQTSVRLLREAGKEVLVFAPERLWLGAFSMNKGSQAFEQARAGTLCILESEGDNLLGCQHLK
ncbi:MAG: hypothetical protein GY847_39185 [Proteobacteria bacterium]|nr:hypothetical protein [Pseudomonadota bacterium]